MQRLRSQIEKRGRAQYKAQVEQMRDALMVDIDGRLDEVKDSLAGGIEQLVRQNVQGDIERQNVQRHREIKYALRVDLASQIESKVDLISA